MIRLLEWQRGTLRLACSPQFVHPQSLLCPVERFASRVARHGCPQSCTAGACTEPLQNLAIIFSLLLFPQPQEPHLGAIIASAHWP